MAERVSAKLLFLGVPACPYPSHINAVNIGILSLIVLTRPPLSLTISFSEMGRKMGRKNHGTANKASEGPFSNKS
jgi:hypothetical protein